MLLPPLNHKGFPLMVKNLKNSPIVVFQSSRLPLWCPERNAKQFSSLQSTVSEKIENNRQKCQFFSKMPIFGAFWAVVLDFFRNDTLLKAKVFFVAFRALRRSFWAIKNNYQTIFQIFHPKGGPLWFRGGKILPTPLNMVEIVKQKQFWNQCD